MVRTGTDEMGVLSVGCNTTTNSSPGTLYETSYQVAQTWASLPPPDNYTPSKAQTAYRTIFDGLLNIAAGLPHNRYSQQVAVAQDLDGSDSTDWPSIDANGIPLPPQSPQVPAVLMYEPMLAQAGTDALDCFAHGGTLSNGITLSNCETVSQLGSVAAASEAIFGWPGLFNDSTSNPGTFSGRAVPGVVIVVNAGAQSGTGVKWQFNNDSNSASIASAYIAGWPVEGLSQSGSIGATSCAGREGAMSPYPICNPVSQFGTIEMLAAESSGGAISIATTLSVSGPGINPPSVYGTTTLLLQWLEVAPIEGLPMSTNGGSTTLGPFYGCFRDFGAMAPSPIGPDCPPP